MCRFLPAPSVRRATFAVFEKLRNLTISIHALREEGDPAVSAVFCKMQNFYPRPPRGGRPAVAVSVTSIFLFLSTPSARRATDGLRSNLQTQLISIHALREEGDSALRGRGNGRKNFYPRPPRGGRPGRSAAQPIVPRFLSTPSARRATKPFQSLRCCCPISIHALREEGDFVCRPFFLQ